ncbi:Serine protease inhibitor family protein [Perilla frutescens var. hirtella]|nr:Serine protease inhibitor family protein [Perilla frutescens var. hirtella]
MQQQQTTTAMELRRSILDQTNASLSLAGHVSSAYSEKSNFVFSPMSIQVLLGMIASGSDGPTRDQILSFLRSKSLEKLHALFSQTVSSVLADGGPVGGPVLSSANGLWVDQSLTLKPAYRNIVYNVYRAVSEHVDFLNKASAVREEVNAWAERETNGLIKEILRPGAIDSTTRFILANAIYFKGAWDQKFDAFSTKERHFYLLNGTSVKAPLMSSLKKQYVRCCDGFKVLRLPYKRGEDTRSFSMYVYLPDEKDGLLALTRRVCSEAGFISNHLPYSLEKLDDFGLPKFKINFGFEASSVLVKLGLVLPFQKGSLTEMVDSSFPLEVSGIIHEAIIEVNEEGVEAAAVSIAAPGCCFVERKRLEFVADHPFLFLIREDYTGLVLFIGQLLNPLD